MSSPEVELKPFSRLCDEEDRLTLAGRLTSIVKANQPMFEVDFPGVIGRYDTNEKMTAEAIQRARRRSGDEAFGAYAITFAGRTYGVATYQQPKPTSGIRPAGHLRRVRGPNVAAWVDLEDPARPRGIGAAVLDLIADEAGADLETQGHVWTVARPENRILKGCPLTDKETTNLLIRA